MVYMIAIYGIRFCFIRFILVQSENWIYLFSMLLKDYLYMYVNYIYKYQPAFQVILARWYSDERARESLARRNSLRAGTLATEFEESTNRKKKSNERRINKKSKINKSNERRINERKTNERKIDEEEQEEQNQRYSNCKSKKQDEENEPITLLELLSAEEEMQLSWWQKELRFWVSYIDDLEQVLTSFGSFFKREYFFFVPEILDYRVFTAKQQSLLEISHHILQNALGSKAVRPETSAAAENHLNEDNSNDQGKQDNQDDKNKQNNQRTADFGNNNKNTADTQKLPSDRKSSFSASASIADVLTNAYITEEEKSVDKVVRRQSMRKSTSSRETTVRRASWARHSMFKGFFFDKTGWMEDDEMTRKASSSTFGMKETTSSSEDNDEDHQNGRAEETTPAGEKKNGEKEKKQQDRTRKEMKRKRMEIFAFLEGLIADVLATDEMEDAESAERRDMAESEEGGEEPAPQKEKTSPSQETKKEQITSQLSKREQPARRLRRAREKRRKHRQLSRRRREKMENIERDKAEREYRYVIFCFGIEVIKIKSIPYFSRTHPRGHLYLQKLIQSRVSTLSKLLKLGGRTEETIEGRMEEIPATEAVASAEAAMVEPSSSPKPTVAMASTETTTETTEDLCLGKTAMAAPGALSGRGNKNVATTTASKFPHPVEDAEDTRPSSHTVPVVLSIPPVKMLAETSKIAETTKIAETPTTMANTRTTVTLGCGTKSTTQEEQDRNLRKGQKPPTAAGSSALSKTSITASYVAVNQERKTFNPTRVGRKSKQEDTKGVLSREFLQPAHAIVRAEVTVSPSAYQDKNTLLGPALREHQAQFASVSALLQIRMHRQFVLRAILKLNSSLLMLLCQTLFAYVLNPRCTYNDDHSESYKAYQNIYKKQVEQLERDEEQLVGNSSLPAMGVEGEPVGGEPVGTGSTSSEVAGFVENNYASNMLINVSNITTNISTNRSTNASTMANVTNIANLTNAAAIPSTAWSHQRCDQLNSDDTWHFKTSPYMLQISILLFAFDLLELSHGLYAQYKNLLSWRYLKLLVANTVGGGEKTDKHRSSTKINTNKAHIFLYFTMTAFVFHVVFAIRLFEDKRNVLSENCNCWLQYGFYLVVIIIIVIM